MLIRMSCIVETSSVPFWESDHETDLKPHTYDPLSRLTAHILNTALASDEQACSSETTSFPAVEANEPKS